MWVCRNVIGTTDFDGWNPTLIKMVNGGWFMALLYQHCLDLNYADVPPKEIVYGKIYRNSPQNVMFAPTCCRRIIATDGSKLMVRLDSTLASDLPPKV